MATRSDIRLYWTLTEHWQIAAASAASNTFTIDGVDLTDHFYPSRPFSVIESGTTPTCDGDYTVLSVAYSSGDTVITVADVPADIASPTGVIYFTGIYPILAADDSDNTFTFADDLTEELEAGATFNNSGAASGNDGPQTVQAEPTYNPQTNRTTVVSNNVGADQAADGFAQKTQHFLHLEWADFDLDGESPAVILRDRLKQAHRIVPPSEISAQKYPSAGVLQLEDFDILCVASNNYTFPELLYNLAVIRDTEFVLFHLEEQIDLRGNPHTSKRAYKVRFENPWPVLGSLSVVDGETVDISLPMTITADGTFTNFNNPSSATYRTRPGTEQ